MRPRLLTIGVLVGTLGTGLLASSSAATPVNAPATVRCYDQLELSETGVGITAQKFEPEMDDLTDRGADDFTLPKPCAVRSVDVLGTYYDGLGLPDSENVVVYAGGVGGPGAPVTRQTVVDSTPTIDGSFHLVLKRPLRLDPGTYWLSVRVNMNFFEAGQWGWMTTSALHGPRARWKNPGDGFGTGCTTYTAVRKCFGDIDQGPDFMFSINRSR